jgi:drug/metabolite transporter (DMT)-like permease
MFIYVFSIVLVVLSNVVYNVAQKSTPKGANPFTALLVTYITAAVLTIILSLFYKTEDNFFASFTKLNWTSIALGVAIVGLEFGYLLAYRAGWNISLGSLVANIALAIILIPVGVIAYKEGFELHKIFGVVLCLAGLVVINR